MPLPNTKTRYGAIAKTFHWTVGLGILAMIALGFFAKALPADTSEQIALKAQLFTLHKTVGIALFVLALLRISWALFQPKPAPYSDESNGALLAASVAHWLLYALLILVPVTGWIHHAATTGFAPIAWPFGQSLPFVPKDPEVAHLFANLHFGFIAVLCATVALHIAGALKHHFVDKDDTLRRMLPGDPPVNAPTASTPNAIEVSAPFVAAAVLSLAVVLSSGLLTRPSASVAPEAGNTIPEVERAASGMAWQVEAGEIGITIQQMGAPVSGRFADWSAAIVFSEDSTDNVHGSVRVTISIPSLTLGSVTETAKEPGYFDAETFPTATYDATLLAAEEVGTFLAEGTLTIKGTPIALSTPFTLDLDGNAARATLNTTLDRRDFGIGLDQTSEGTLGFGVGVAISLTARQIEGS